MKENQRLKKLFKDHFDGAPWIDVQIRTSLEGMDPKDAARHIHGLNSVWQIVHHMTSWRETILQRIQGKHIPSPANNYFIEVKDTSSKAWSNTLKKLLLSQGKLMDHLSEEIKGADEKPGNGSYTHYELLQGLLQHDAYHLGQIVLIRKMLEASAGRQ